MASWAFCSVKACGALLGFVDQAHGFFVGLGDGGGGGLLGLGELFLDALEFLLAFGDAGAALFEHLPGSGRTRISSSTKIDEEKIDHLGDEKRPVDTELSEIVSKDAVSCFGGWRVGEKWWSWRKMDGWKPKTARRRAGFRGPGAGELDYLHGEGGKDEHPFDEGGENDRDHEDRGGGTRIAAGGFRGLGAEDADAETGAERGQGDVDVTGFQLSMGMMAWCVFGVLLVSGGPTVMPWSGRRKGLMMLFLAACSQMS